MRSYLEKGPAPRFLRVVAPGVTVLDRIPAGRGAELKRFAERAPSALPSFCRPNVLEMIDLAKDEEQSFYRVLALEAAGAFAAVVGFGLVSGCEGTYDFFGCVGVDPGWALRGVEVWATWLREAGARLARAELDRAGEVAFGALAAEGFAREGTLRDFYGPGDDQRLLIWRPAR